jgi:hypothetical protein
MPRKPPAQRSPHELKLEDATKKKTPPKAMPSINASAMTMVTAMMIAPGVFPST